MGQRTHFHILLRIFSFVQASVRFHTCCMMTCTLNGGGHDTLPRNPTSKEEEAFRRGGPPLTAVPIVVPPPLPPAQAPNRVLGMRASDIDKYSRVIFPIMFLSFHLMYWMIYLSISGDIPENLVYLVE
jgi:hypothetical protein